MRRADIEMRRRKFPSFIQEVITKQLSLKVTNELCGPIRDRLYDVQMETYVECILYAGRKART